MTVSWISAGVSSFIATYLVCDKVDKCLYIDIDDHHEDNMRFIKDCEKLLGMEIEIIKSPYNDVETACRHFGFINGPSGARCTYTLKKQVRKQWEKEQTEPLTYIWGMDFKEKDRADNIVQAMQYAEHIFPLIDAQLSKEDAHGMCKRLGLKRPAMYDLGYNNNNCIGCVKGGFGYWNKIRVDFPDVFAKRAKMERDMQQTCLKGKIYLDELDPRRGWKVREIIEDCGIACELSLK